MKQWLETRQVFDRLAELEVRGIQTALATVVRVRGSAYRHEGAKMLVAADGSTIGNVSGGCLEADVREVAMQTIASGELTSREYCASSDQVAAWDLGVGCEGSVYVHVHRSTASNSGAIAGARTCLAGHKAFALCTDLRTGRMLTIADGVQIDSADAAIAARARDLLLDGGVSATYTVGSREIFIDLLTPPPVLVIASAGDDARHLARFAVSVGFRTIVIDRRPGLLDPSRFADGVELVESDAESLPNRLVLDDENYAVVMNHNYADDREWLRALLRSSVSYIGMLGPRQRTERIIREIQAGEAVDENRIYGPVGLDIGTDGAEQVALSVIAEVLAVRSGRTPASLRERRMPIHADAS